MNVVRSGHRSIGTQAVSFQRHIGVTWMTIRAERSQPRAVVLLAKSFHGLAQRSPEGESTTAAKSSMSSNFGRVGSRVGSRLGGRVGGRVGNRVEKRAGGWAWQWRRSLAWSEGPRHVTRRVKTGLKTTRKLLLKNQAPEPSQAKPGQAKPEARRTRAKPIPWSSPDVAASGMHCETSSVS